MRRALGPLAVERGGNCPLSEPGKVVEKHGVTLVGLTNLPALVPTDASALYARNLLDFMKLIVDKSGALAIQREDEIVAACMRRTLPQAGAALPSGGGHAQTRARGLVDGAPRGQVHCQKTCATN